MCVWGRVADKRSPHCMGCIISHIFQIMLLLLSSTVGWVPRTQQPFPRLHSAIPKMQAPFEYLSKAHTNCSSIVADFLQSSTPVASGDQNRFPGAQQSLWCHEGWFVNWGRAGHQRVINQRLAQGLGGSCGNKDRGTRRDIWEKRAAWGYAGKALGCGKFANVSDGTWSGDASTMMYSVRVRLPKWGLGDGRPQPAPQKHPPWEMAPRRCASA